MPIPHKRFALRVAAGMWLCLGSLPTAGAPPSPIEPAIQEFASRMFRGVRASLQICEESPRGAEATALCAAFPGGFSSFKFQWESELKIHYRDSASSRGSWRFRSGAYVHEYDLESHSVTVHFDEGRHTIELVFLEITRPVPELTADTEADPARASRPEEEPRIAKSGAELFCGDPGTSPEDFDGATVPMLIPHTKLDPEYPEGPRIGRFEGKVVLRTRIDLSGAVVESIVVEAEPAGQGFEEASIVAVAQWRYWPATQHGDPIEVCLCIYVNFTLH